MWTKILAVRPQLVLVSMTNYQRKSNGVGCAAGILYSVKNFMAGEIKGPHMCKRKTLSDSDQNMEDNVTSWEDYFIGYL